MTARKGIFYVTNMLQILMHNSKVLVTEVGR